MAKSLRTSLIWLTVFAFPALLVLVGLGVWQVQRLAWKDAMLADLAAKQTAAAMDIATLDRNDQAGENIDYLPVAFSGTYVGSKELRLYWVHEGEAGWRLTVPVQLSDGSVVLLDRGFVTQSVLDRLIPPSGPVNITGRALREKAQGVFTPDNEPANNVWYWRDVAAMAQALGVNPARVKPYVILADRSGGDESWPLALATPPRIENRHLGYAITWFGLAACLVGVYGAYMVSMLRSTKRGR